MKYLALIGSILAIHIFAWLTPGPLFVLIIRNSLVYSRKTGFWTALGIGLGNTIHISYAIAGLSFLFEASSTLSFVLTLLGVLYLSYLGIKTFRVRSTVQKTVVEEEQTEKDLSSFQAFKTGFLTNILSPKASLFFASIFGSVIGGGAPQWVIIVLWILMPLNSVFMAALLSIFFTQTHIRKVYERYQIYVNRLLGVALLVLAGLILWNFFQ